MNESKPTPGASKLAATLRLLPTALLALLARRLADLGPVCLQGLGGLGGGLDLDQPPGRWLARTLTA